jgi:hypothetical protein
MYIEWEACQKANLVFNFIQEKFGIVTPNQPTNSLYAGVTDGSSGNDTQDSRKRGAS